MHVKNYMHFTLKLWWLLTIYWLILEWPEGKYGLPKTNSGCPVAAPFVWKTGWRKHDTEDRDSDNQWSSNNHFPLWYNKNNMQQHFCMKDFTSHSTRPWPRGNYCIFKKGTCPAGISILTNNRIFQANISNDRYRVDLEFAFSAYLYSQAFRNTWLHYSCLLSSHW